MITKTARVVSELECGSTVHLPEFAFERDRVVRCLLMGAVGYTQGSSSRVAFILVPNDCYW